MATKSETAAPKGAAAKVTPAKTAKVAAAPKEKSGGEVASGTQASQIPAATKFDPSGAPHQLAGIDVSHPAVDADPRANTTADQNRIDFNDPGLSGSDAVTKALSEQNRAED